MKNTELKHWKNGIQKRGKDFYTIAGSIKNKSNIGIILNSKKVFYENHSTNNKYR